MSLSVSFGDGGNPSPSGEAKFRVTWLRATLSSRRNTKSDLKVHVVWIPKYRKSVLTGAVALRVRDLIRQIAAQHELEIISGKVARDHVHVFLSYRVTQKVSQLMQWLKGTSSRVLLQEFPHLRKEFWGRHFCSLGYLAVSSGNITDEMIQEYIDEQEGEQIADDSRFPIDSP